VTSTKIDLILCHVNTASGILDSHFILWPPFRITPLNLTLTLRRHSALSASMIAGRYPQGPLSPKTVALWGQWPLGIAGRYRHQSSGLTLTRAYGSIEAGGRPPLEAIGISRNFYWGGVRSEAPNAPRSRRRSVEGRGMGLACPLPQPTRGSGSVRFAGEGWRCLTPNPLDEDDLPTGGRKFRSGGRLRPSGPVSAENVAFFLLLKPVCDLKICQECVCNRGSAPDPDGGAHKSHNPQSL